MLDLRYVSQNLEEVEKALLRRGPDLDLSRLGELAKKRIELITRSETARHEQKEASAKVPTLAKESPEQAAELRARLKVLADEVKEGERLRAEVEKELEDLLLNIPNTPHSSVPEGNDESANIEVRKGKHAKPSFDFKPRPHWELGEALGILDFERAAKVSGARFTFLLGAGARLERALVAFMMDLHAAKGYREVIPPFLVNRQSMTGTGQLPKFEDDAFKTADEKELFLIPTAEVPVTNFHRDEILDGQKLPLRYVAYSPCFRAEAGSHGKDTRGLIRQHQFEKVELVHFVEPETSWDALEELTADACEVLEKLGLHYRVMTLCTGDLGFSAAKTYDLEVWLPGQDTYREISSCSNFEDYQARRAQIRYRPEAKAKPRLVHTLNGSGLAVGRTLLAVLENYQQEDGSVMIPEVLRPYMGGLEVIRRE